MKSDFDKTMKGIFHSVKSTFNPDYAIPAEQANQPLNVRIQRMKDAANEINTQLDALGKSMSAFTTNLNALTEEIQPYLAKEQNAASPTQTATPAATDAPATPAATDAPATPATPAADDKASAADATNTDETDKK